MSGRLLLGAYKPEAPAVRNAFNWELENGFKQVIPDRVDAERELAVVLVGSGDGAGLDRAETAFIGGSLLPATIVVRSGVTLLVRNEDEVAHEAYAEGLDKFAAEAISPRGRRTVKLDKAGDWALADRLIPHVEGHLHVLDNLVAVAQVGEDGRFTFTDVPAGSYTLKVFHGKQELASSPVEVSDKPLTLDPMALSAQPAATEPAQEEPKEEPAEAAE